MSNQGELTKVPDVPQGVNGGVTFVKNNEEWWGGDTFCQVLTIQILPAQTSKVHLS